MRLDLWTPLRNHIKVTGGADSVVGDLLIQIACRANPQGGPALAAMEECLAKLKAIGGLHAG